MDMYKPKVNSGPDDATMNLTQWDDPWSRYADVVDNAESIHLARLPVFDAAGRRVPADKVDRTFTDGTLVIARLRPK